MKIHSSYKVKIRHYNRIFDRTIRLYRDAVDFFIDVIESEWEDISGISAAVRRVNAVEKLTIRTAKRPSVRYDFGASFYKFPSYLRRAAISESLGKVSSHRSNLDNWMKADPLSRGRKPARPHAGQVLLHPCFSSKHMESLMYDICRHIHGPKGIRILLVHHFLDEVFGRQFQVSVLTKIPPLWIQESTRQKTFMSARIRLQSQLSLFRYSLILYYHIRVSPNLQILHIPALQLLPLYLLVFYSL